MELVERIMSIIILVQHIGHVQMDERLCLSMKFNELSMISILVLQFLNDPNHKVVIDIKSMICKAIMLEQLQMQVQL